VMSLDLEIKVICILHFDDGVILQDANDFDLKVK